MRARQIISHHEMREDASDQTLLIPPRFNPAIDKTERYPAFQNKRQVLKHLIAVRGQVVSNANDCFRDPVILAKSNLATLRLMARHA